MTRCRSRQAHYALNGIARELGVPLRPEIETAGNLESLNDESPAGLEFSARQGEITVRPAVFRDLADVPGSEFGADDVATVRTVRIDELRRALGEIAVATDAPYDGTAPRDERKNVDVVPTSYPNVYRIQRSCDACRAVFVSWHPFPDRPDPVAVERELRFPAPDLCRVCRGERPGGGARGRRRPLPVPGAAESPVEALRDYLTPIIARIGADVKRFREEIRRAADRFESAAAEIARHEIRADLGPGGPPPTRVDDDPDPSETLEYGTRPPPRSPMARALEADCRCGHARAVHRRFADGCMGADCECDEFRPERTDP